MAESTEQRLTGKAVVVAAMADHPAVRALVAWNDDALVDAVYDRGELTLTIAAKEICAAAAAVQRAGYNFLEDVTAVDWFPATPRFQVSYHILSHSLKEYIRLSALVGGDSPVIDSITAVWPSANYYEREIFDLFGVAFAGHPNLRRILMPDDWQGHPLRKDYPVEGYR